MKLLSYRFLSVVLIALMVVSAGVGWAVYVTQHSAVTVYRQQKTVIVNPSATAAHEEPKADRRELKKMAESLAGC